LAHRSGPIYSLFNVAAAAFQKAHQPLLFFIAILLQPMSITVNVIIDITSRETHNATVSHQAIQNSFEQWQ